MAGFRTHIGRSIDPSHPSVRLALNIAALAGAAGVAFGWFGGRDWRVGGVTGLVWAAASFLAWATTRELHHDNSRPAVFAAILAPAGVAVFGAPSFLIGGALLLLGRVSLGSTGRRPLVTDLATLTLLGLWIARSPAGWSVAIVTAVALARVRAPGARDGRPWALVLSAGATGVLALSGGFTLGTLDSAAPIALAIGAVLGKGIASRASPRVETDRGGEPPSASDQFTARLLVLIGVLFATLISADPAIVLPAAAGLVSLSIRSE